MKAIEPAQLKQWYEQYGRELVLYVRGWLGAGPAEDVVQEVFIRLFQQRTAPENVRAWLYRSVRNEGVSEMRREQRRRTHHSRLALRQAWFEPQPESRTDAEAAEQALKMLPKELREIVILRIWGRMGFREIAELTGRPVSTVHHDYKKALQTIKQRLESCHTITD